MKFGKDLRNEITEKLPEWEGEFISYKDLKKQLNLIAPWHNEESKRPRKRPKIATDDCVITEEQNTNLTGEETGFIQLLRDELEKINSFFDDKEEEYVIRLKELRDEVAVLEGSGGNATRVLLYVASSNSNRIAEDSQVAKEEDGQLRSLAIHAEGSAAAILRH
ncbi:hypothetical protein RJ639_007095 [Escallonia herrerae]|uniref:SPX domain-containing protein n=1 Tax=Escallonia herrerae TaxID=1293975 RepID=A0AA88VYE7_9ASTE|nr:hypothetical protein RJ639_007095 [Escallonia herrerae]